MSGYPKLNLPIVKMRIKRSGACLYVWDSLRGKYLLLTPEERVRRHIIGFLTTHLNIRPESIVQEYPVEINGLAQRADIVVFDTGAKALILIECKAPGVKVDGDVFAQAVRYNSVVKAKYIILTNGISTFCHSYDNGEYTPLKEFPRF